MTSIARLFKPLLRGAVVLLLFAEVAPALAQTPPPPPPPPPPQALPTAKEQCYNGGWQAFKVDRKSTRLNSSHIQKSRMPSSA